MSESALGKLINVLGSVSAAGVSGRDEPGDGGAGGARNGDLGTCATGRWRAGSAREHRRGV